jgi:LPXTG-motif cell wall-anchored protein
MSKYGYDPCPNSGITLDQFREMISKNEPPPPPKQPVTPVPPTKVDIDGADDNDTTEGSNPWLIYAGVGVVLVVVVLLFVIKRKK